MALALVALQMILTSVSAVECLSLDVAFPYRPPLDHVLRDTVPVVYELSKSSLHLILGLPRFLVCPRSVQNVMQVVQRLPVLLAT